MSRKPHVVVVGGGFTGLAAAFELSRRGVDVSLFEKEEALGGLAGSFSVEGQQIERFYHHWFTNDREILRLTADLGTSDQVLSRTTRTGMFYANSVYRMSTPLDVLRFGPLPPLDRIRLGTGVLRAQRVKDWRSLEGLSAAEWLQHLFGDRVYQTVWEPLLVGKFGSRAQDVSAVWFWKKLVLRGGSRDRGGAEALAYYRGGFASLAETVARAVTDLGGDVHIGASVDGLIVEGGRADGVVVGGSRVEADAVLITPALPIVADLLEPFAPADYLESLRRIEYLANVCLVLVLDRSLSGMYWLNVNDPGFPFVGVIEHTNFEPPATYAGRHIVYLSTYLSPDDELFALSADEILAFSLPHLRRMFPAFDPAWIVGHHVWRARYAQPVVVRNYGDMIPDVRTPIERLYLCSMAQIYPEDRGTNYAIREGRRVAGLVADDVSA
jgi:protoporphyrinogen oxidase